MKKIFLHMLLAGTFFFLAFPLETPEASEREIVKKEKDLEDLKKRMREESESIGEVEKRETSVLAEIEGVDRSIAKKRRGIDKLKASIKKAKGRIEETDRAVKALERERAELRVRLAARMRAIYKMRGARAVKVVFSADGVEELGRRYKVMALIMEQDAELIRRGEENVRRLGEEGERLEELKDELGVQLTRLRSVKKEEESTRRGKKSLLAGMKREKKRHLRLSEELGEAEKELVDIIVKLKKDSAVKRTKGGGAFAAMKGRLRMPVTGPVVASYGKVKHPEFNTYTFNNGIIIEASYATPVTGVFEGKVVYVGWLKGYGQVMIVEHDGGFYTLYGHLHKVLKGRGEAVSRGEHIALVGDSGVHGTPSLYFEVRDGGVPRDPMAWVASR